MNIVEQTRINELKYKELNELLNNKKIINNEDLKDLIFVINKIDNFNINDVTDNCRGQYLYTTIFENFLKTNNPIIIDYIFENYLDKINETITIFDGLTQNITNILYKNLIYQGIKTDYLLKLIFKFEKLDFLSEEFSINKRINILEYMLSNKKDFNCSKKFEKNINKYLKKEFTLKEKDVINKLRLSLRDTKNTLEELKNKNHYTKNMEKILKLIDLINEDK